MGGFEGKEIKALAALFDRLTQSAGCVKWPWTWTFSVYPSVLVPNADSVDPDQTPHYVTSDLVYTVCQTKHMIPVQILQITLLHVRSHLTS